jgi:hypothetical protein
MNLSEISYDPTVNEILGVINNEIHIKAYHKSNIVILILSTELFHKTWDNWLKGKKEYCERWKEYCGVGGYTFIEKGKIIKRKINLYEYNDEGDRTEFFPPVIEVTEFSDYHDFEHG